MRAQLEFVKFGNSGGVGWAGARARVTEAGTCRGRWRAGARALRLAHVGACFQGGARRCRFRAGFAARAAARGVGGARARACCGGVRAAMTSARSRVVFLIAAGARHARHVPPPRPPAAPPPARAGQPPREQGCKRRAAGERLDGAAFATCGCRCTDRVYPAVGCGAARAAGRGRLGWPPRRPRTAPGVSRTVPLRRFIKDPLPMTQCPLGFRGVRSRRIRRCNARRGRCTGALARRGRYGYTPRRRGAPWRMRALRGARPETARRRGHRTEARGH